MKVSILTINLNNKTGLEKTMLSVFEQDYPDFEFIIVDGGSKDGSCELIESESRRISKWISEKDNGIYNAMNKAIKLAVGEYCFFLNSGDYFVNNKVLSTVFKRDIDADIISGNVLKVRDTGKWNRVKSHNQVNLLNLMRHSLPHQGSFIKRSLFDSIGYYNEQYRIISDWEFFLKALVLNKSTYEHVEVDISYFMLDGISSQRTSTLLARKESEDCIERHFGYMKDDLIEYRYFYNSYIGIMYMQLKGKKTLFRITEKFCENLFFLKKRIYGSNIMLDKIKKTGKNTAIYGIGNVLNKSLGLILIPFVQQFIPIEEYGWLTLIELIFLALSFTIVLGITNGHERFFYNEKDNGSYGSFLFSKHADFICYFTYNTNSPCSFQCSDFSVIFKSVEYQSAIILALIITFFEVNNIIPFRYCNTKKKLLNISLQTQYAYL
jgi:glycosyltransferase involved in cell wall biosynthesis